MQQKYQPIMNEEDEVSGSSQETSMNAFLKGSASLGFKLIIVVVVVFLMVSAASTSEITNSLRSEKDKVAALSAELASVEAQLEGGSLSSLLGKASGYAAVSEYSTVSVKTGSVIIGNMAAKTSATVDSSSTYTGTTLVGTAATYVTIASSTARTMVQNKATSTVLSSSELGGQTLYPGIYNPGKSTTIKAGGTLTLDCMKSTISCEWYFKGTTMTMGAGSKIVLTNVRSNIVPVVVFSMTSTIALSGTAAEPITADSAAFLGGSTATVSYATTGPILSYSAVTITGSTVDA